LLIDTSENGRCQEENQDVVAAAWLSIYILILSKKRFKLLSLVRHRGLEGAN